MVQLTVVHWGQSEWGWTQGWKLCFFGSQPKFHIVNEYEIFSKPPICPDSRPHWPEAPKCILAKGP